MIGQYAPLLVLGLEDTYLEDDVKEDVEGVVAGDIVFCEGGKDDCFVKTLAKDLEPTWFHGAFRDSQLYLSSILLRIPYSL